MADKSPTGNASVSGMEKAASGFFPQSLRPLRERLQGGVAAALNGVLRVTGVKLQIKDTATADPPKVPPVPPVAVAVSETSAAQPIKNPFPPAPLESPRLPFSGPMGGGIPAPPRAPLPFKPLPNFAAPPVARKLAAPPKEPPRGPTQVQVMTAVQNAVVGAVKMISGTVDGVGAARDAARAAAKTATGAASVATGVATVASGFFPQLAALGVGVPKAPKNKPGMRPQRRVAEILANPIGRTVQPGIGNAPGEPPRPTKRIQRLPIVRAKSSLELGRKTKAPKPRSYTDLQMRPQIGLTPHEILLKVATLALGKTLLGFLEAGARAQQQALQRVNDRMSQRQVMLLGMLPAQYIVKRLPQAPAETPPSNSVPSRSDQAGPVSSSVPGNPGSGFKFRY